MATYTLQINRAWGRVKGNESQLKPIQRVLEVLGTAAFTRHGDFVTFAGYTFPEQQLSQLADERVILNWSENQ
jgi:hypothetical protein